MTGNTEVSWNRTVFGVLRAIRRFRVEMPVLPTNRPGPINERIALNSSIEAETSELPVMGSLEAACIRGAIPSVSFWHSGAEILL